MADLMKEAAVIFVAAVDPPEPLFSWDDDSALASK
jgi:hypothetical protein